MSDPMRLLDQADISDAERAALRMGVSAPIEYDVGGGAARFRASLAALGVAGAAGAATHTGAALTGKALLAKVALEVFLGLLVVAPLVGAGLAVGIHVARSNHAANVAAKVATPLDVVAAPRERVDPTPLPLKPSVPAAQPAASPPAPGRSHAPRSASKARRNGPAQPAPGAAPGPEPESASGSPSEDMSEMVTSNAAPSATVATPQPAPPIASQEPTPVELSDSMTEARGIALARKLVDRDPEAALLVLERLRRQYPRGYFVEERQALTVLALARSGRASAAREQGLIFLGLYPNGPFAERVRAATGP